MRRGRVLFAGLTFVLEAGDAALVSGPNGAGKSSLIRRAAGLMAGSGTARADGAIALLAEAGVLDPEQRLGDALAFWARIDGARDARADVAAALESVALAPLADVPVRLLSTGQRRRAGMARVIAAAAPIWLLDELTSGLDDASVATCERLVAAHRADGGIAVVASHLPFALPGARAIRLGEDA